MPGPLLAKLGAPDERLDWPLEEAQARLRKWVKRALAQLPAASLNRIAATCAMHLDMEALKQTGKSPGHLKLVVDELAAQPVAKARKKAQAQSLITHDQ